MLLKPLVIAAAFGLCAGMAAADPPFVQAKPLIAAPQRPVTSISPDALAGPQDCETFNNADVTIGPAAGGWAVKTPAKILVQFYYNKAAAEHGHSIIRGYGFDQQCFVGRAPGGLMYWKVAGKLPMSQMSGEDCVTVNPAGTYVANFTGTWIVMSGVTQVATYGHTDKAGADRAVQLIKTFKMNRLCFIKRPNAAMTYWLSM